ncbi:hypothetical protein [Nocardia fluminea]|uniref:hypothetical protein n=1 Tax=Nocardia fluminea TaxID=134984 RepID=UPI000C70631D|nr:hypothetical protein [Nocardia fluminea]
MVDPTQRPNEFSVRLRADLTPRLWRDAVADRPGPGSVLVLPIADERATCGLKFSDVLPDNLAAATVFARLADVGGARQVLDDRISFRLV